MLVEREIEPAMSRREQQIGGGGVAMAEPTRGATAAAAAVAAVAQRALARLLEWVMWDVENYPIVTSFQPQCRGERCCKEIHLQNESKQISKA